MLCNSRAFLYKRYDVFILEQIFQFGIKKMLLERIFYIMLLIQKFFKFLFCCTFRIYTRISDFYTWINNEINLQTTTTTVSSSASTTVSTSASTSTSTGPSTSTSPSASTTPSTSTAPSSSTAASSTTTPIGFGQCGFSINTPNARIVGGSQAAVIKVPADIIFL